MPQVPQIKFLGFGPRFCGGLAAFFVAVITLLLHNLRRHAMLDGGG